MIRKPYLLFLGDAGDQLAAKVAQGIRDWRPDDVVGQLRLTGCKADVGTVEMSLQEAWAAGARTLVVGVANRGGVISELWIDVFAEALEMGYDLAAGLHNRLNDIPRLCDLVARTSTRMFDVRVPTIDYPIASGRKRAGKRCLAVGTDVSVGKMYTCLAIDRELASRGIASTFRATGQTGILIDGGGVPLDAVVADFMAGAVEWLTPDNDPQHWDIIEGQGSLFHMSYSGVTLSLIHGGQPDALILCHDPLRKQMRGTPDHSVPELDKLRDIALEMGRMANPECRAVAVAANTSAMTAQDADACVAEIEDRLGLPAADPVRHGAHRLVDALITS